MFTIPNIITMFRIAIVPFFLSTLYSGLQDKLKILLILLFLAGISDVLDGFIARKFNMKSKVGAVLDPFADKLMQISVLLCLLHYKWIPMGIVVFLFIKELILCIGAMYLYKNGCNVSSDHSGKLATFVFYISSFAFIIFEPADLIKYILFTIIVLTALYAFIDYSIIFIKYTNLFKRNEKNGREKQS